MIITIMHIVIHYYYNNANDHDHRPGLSCPVLCVMFDCPCRALCPRLRMPCQVIKNADMPLHCQVGAIAFSSLAWHWIGALCPCHSFSCVKASSNLIVVPVLSVPVMSLPSFRFMLLAFPFLCALPCHATAWPYLISWVCPSVPFSLPVLSSPVHGQVLPLSALTCLFLPCLPLPGLVPCVACPWLPLPPFAYTALASPGSMHGRALHAPWPVAACPCLSVCCKSFPNYCLSFRPCYGMWHCLSSSRQHRVLALHCLAWPLSLHVQSSPCTWC